jgi:hypothetical protein
MTFRRSRLFAVVAEEAVNSKRLIELVHPDFSDLFRSLCQNWHFWHWFDAVWHCFDAIWHSAVCFSHWGIPRRNRMCGTICPTLSHFSRIEPWRPGKIEEVSRKGAKLAKEFAE